MPKKNWKRARANSLQEAIRLDLDFARDKHGLSVQRIGDLLGVSEWTVYDWLQKGSIPGRKILGFEHVCRSHFVTDYLCHANHRLVIGIPSGKPLSAEDLTILQGHLTGAVAHLLDFKQEPTEENADAALAAITTGLEDLSWHKRNLEQSPQPEFEFEEPLPAFLRRQAD